MSLMSEIEKFKKETGITDDKTDAIIASAYSFGSGMYGIDRGENVTTTARDAGETVDLDWVVAFIDTVSKSNRNARAEAEDVAEDKSDEDVYDSTWCVAPEALPAHEEESEGE